MVSLQETERKTYAFAAKDLGYNWLALDASNSPRWENRNSEGPSENDGERQRRGHFLSLSRCEE